VGATLGLVSLVLLGYLFLRKWKRKRVQHGPGGYPPPPPPPPHHHPNHQPGVSHQAPYPFHEYGQLKMDAGLVGYGVPGQWNGLAELMAKSGTGNYGPAELPAGR
jgi:hypothetical protein